jgi:hypothetical protein
MEDVCITVCDGRKDLPEAITGLVPDGGPNLDHSPELGPFRYPRPAILGRNVSFHHTPRASSEEPLEEFSTISADIHHSHRLGRTPGPSSCPD